MFWFLQLLLHLLYSSVNFFIRQVCDADMGSTIFHILFMPLFPEVPFFLVFDEVHVLFGLDFLSSEVPVLGTRFDLLLVLLLDSLMEAG